MPLHIANLLEADRRTATAGETMDMGMVVKVQSDNAGGRYLMKLADGDSALAVSGNVGVVYKVGTDAFQVDSSTVPTEFGSRLVTIASGDLVVEVRKGAILEYSLDLLHSSLTSSGVQNCIPGEKLEIKDSTFCKAGTSGAITSPIVGRCYGLRGTTTVLVELVY